MFKSTLALAAALIIAACPVFAAKNVTVGDIIYSVDTGKKTAKVVGRTKALEESGKAKIKGTVTVDGVACTVTAIDKEAFYGAHLFSLSIPATVKTIGTRAFASNFLSKLTLPEDLTIIGTSAFDEALYNSADLVIPKKVTIIRKNAFRGCPLKSLTFAGNKIEEIGDYAFNSASNTFTSITIPAVDVLGDGVLCGNRNLKTCVIKAKVQKLGDQFFNNCTALTSVTLPSTIIEIGQWCFSECVSLKALPAMPNLQVIGPDAFYKCSFTTLHDLPASLEVIGPNAFNECTALTSVIIPKSVKSIGDYAFDYCKNIRSVTVLGDSPSSSGGMIEVPSIPNLGICGFSTETYFNATLTIPAGTFNAYGSHREWSCFRHIVDPAASSIQAPLADTPVDIRADIRDIYDLNGRRYPAEAIHTLPAGLYIIRTPAGTAKIRL